MGVRETALPRVSRDLRLAAALALALVALLVAGAAGAAGHAPAGPAPAAAAVTFKPCPSVPSFGCTRITVPLDPSGQVPGTLSLAVERRLAGRSPSSVAVVALSGGPGQSATPLAKDLEQSISPGLRGHDLIVFDQRGTGASEPLRCAALASGPSTPRNVARCAVQLGPDRAFYTSADSVADIEAIRQALGYSQLILYGTSYGTKVALLYALAHPAQTAALVLDSTVLPTGPDAFGLSTFAAIPRVLSQLCAGGACAGVTANPVTDLGALVARLMKAPLTGTVFDGNGRPHRVRMGPLDMLSLLVAGDEDPVLRAEEPAAVHAALHGDAPPLLRLLALANGAVPGDGAHLAARLAASASAPVGDQEMSDGIDNALFADTICEEEVFPWDRSAGKATRLAQARAAAAAIPATSFLPFSASTSLRFGPIDMCAGWPDASPPPPTTYGPITGIPTLIISGAADLRTPTADAQTAAADIAGSQLLVVPHTGHSVLGSDFSHCSHDALVAFFAGTPVSQCPNDANPFPPTLAFAAHLDQVGRLPGVGGRAGFTANAVRRTIGDLHEEIASAILSGDLGVGARFGGLRGGYAVITTNGVILHDVVFVPGIDVSGVAPVIAGQGPDELTVTGPQASPGALLITETEVVGRLGGIAVDYRPATPASTAGPQAAVAKIAAANARAARVAGGDPSAGDATELLAPALEQPGTLGFRGPALAHLP